ncbi:MAG: tRNA (adenosine(37)-N6)-threonylcarbamoyltransferase complex dimerization subunit type 1 TsaB [Clostridia bacterium]|nr:tRNA (adenosine(37)-N6)-threonylcarbamoyltransferase complex dimerization subunit type 1 TsaB [Clostridia bacterium]
MKILAIDSSSKPVSASVVKDGKVLCEVFVNNGLTHSKTLMPVIKSVMDHSESSLGEIDLCAVVTGPGSFTGVRIGVAAAKGICFNNDIPCVGISTLETMAYNLSCVKGYVCAVMDARCSQVYTATFKCGNGVERVTEDRAISIDDLIAHFKELNGDIYILGDGAELVFSKLVADCEVSNVILVNENNRYQKSSSAALCAGVKAADCYIKADELVPVYLRLPQAERELKNKLK